MPRAEFHRCSLQESAFEVPDILTEQHVVEDCPLRSFHDVSTRANVTCLKEFRRLILADGVDSAAQPHLCFVARLLGLLTIAVNA